MGILLGIGPGLTAMQLSSVIASRWFSDRQGLVIGLMTGATATGTLIFMPLAATISIYMAGEQLWLFQRLVQLLV